MTDGDSQIVLDDITVHHQDRKQSGGHGAGEGWRRGEMENLWWMARVMKWGDERSWSKMGEEVAPYPEHPECH